MVTVPNVIPPGPVTVNPPVVADASPIVIFAVMLIVSVPPPPNKAKVPQPVVVQVFATSGVLIKIEFGAPTKVPLMVVVHPVHVAFNVEIVTLVPTFNAPVI